ncbi:hypothetical protein BCR42DRAFT_416727 [Absidia repens]|uniref:NET domain-containing protein n=1 Tax=Absidia repens TaxID=90262 RepID=A0A1X2IEW5_9FUNG|nr:hypothetical protein BCR42DRAFT_416727 [Absidia repens]
MGGVTIAPQPTKSDNDAFLTSFNANPTSSFETQSDMESLLPSHGWPMEDLTGEVQDLMLRESMNWLPWMDDTNHSVKTGSPLENLDTQLLAQTLQLDGLFGQDLNFGSFDEAGSSLLYDEFTFDPSPVSSQDQQQPYEEVLEQQTHNYAVPVSPQACENKTLGMATEKDDDSSTDDDDDNDESEDDDSDDEQAGPVSVLTTTYMYLPKRQVEEALLNKITHHMHPDKLPGILSIVSSSTDGDDDQVVGEEVEIDLSCLMREQLVRVMLYVDACIAEQQGGPTVKLDQYLVGDSNSGNSSSRKTAKEKRRTMPPAADDGPLSMAALTKKSRSSRKQNLPKTSTATKPKRRRTRRKQQPQGIASTRPTRRAALHKRRMLEDMLLIPSDDDDVNDGSDQQVMVTYGEEEMDFKVVENQTIVHQPLHVTHSSSYGVGGGLSIETNDDDDDEEIDIM